jgi:hypothetical protein
LPGEEPAGETVPKVYDHHDSVHVVHVFLDAFAGTSTQPIREGGFISRATRS